MKPVVGDGRSGRADRCEAGRRDGRSGGADRRCEAGRRDGRSGRADGRRERRPRGAADVGGAGSPPAHVDGSRGVPGWREPHPGGVGRPHAVAIEATFPATVTVAAAAATSDPLTFVGENAPAAQQLAHSTSTGVTSALLLDGQPVVWVTRSPASGEAEASANPTSGPQQARPFRRPSPHGGSLHGGRTVLSGLSNFLAAFTAVATGTASAGGGNGGGGLLPFAALAAFALMTPRLGRRLRLELATWPSSALVLSLERPG